MAYIIQLYNNVSYVCGRKDSFIAAINSKLESVVTL